MCQAARTPVKKEIWEVAQSVRREEQVLSQCNQVDCSFEGTEDAGKMQTHLGFHGLAESEVAQLAGDEAVMASRLKRTVRVVYRAASGLVVGRGPQLSLDTKEALVGQERFLCTAAAECNLAFLTEVMQGDGERS